MFCSAKLRPPESVLQIPRTTYKQIASADKYLYRKLRNKACGSATLSTSRTRERSKLERSVNHNYTKEQKKGFRARKTNSFVWRTDVIISPHMRSKSIWLNLWQKHPHWWERWKSKSIASVAGVLIPRYSAHRKGWRSGAGRKLIHAYVKGSTRKTGGQFSWRLND